MIRCDAVTYEDIGTTKVRDLPCCAPSCERNALIRVQVGPVCNLHYQRWINHRSFVKPKRKPRSCTFTCKGCGNIFERKYGISQRRRRGAQYCSHACVATELRRRAEAGTPARFWAKVDVRGPDECWEWQAYRGEHGYGRFTYAKGDTQQAHRIAYRLSTGTPPGDLAVCHRCDNPPCCNPNHLFLGTAADNVADMIAKGRKARPRVLRGTEIASCRLTPDQAVEVVRSPLSNGDCARVYGVTPAAIYNIRHGRSWSHVTGVPRG